MKDNARYGKIAEWSEEDQCYIGSSSGLVYGGCHGPDEKAVFDELSQVVEEAIALYHRDGKPLPPRHPSGTLPTGCKAQRSNAKSEIGVKLR